MLKVGGKDYKLTDADRKFVMDKSNNGFIVLRFLPKHIKDIPIRNSDDTRGVKKSQPKTLLPMQAAGKIDGHLQMIRYYEGERLPSKPGEPSHFTPENLLVDKDIRKDVNDEKSMELMWYLLKTCPQILDSEQGSPDGAWLYVYDQNKEAKEKRARRKMLSQLSDKIEAMDENTLKDAAKAIGLKSGTMSKEVLINSLFDRMSKKLEDVGDEEFRTKWAPLLSGGEDAELRKTVFNAVQDKTVFLVNSGSSNSPQMKRLNPGWYLTTSNTGSVDPDGYICKGGDRMDDALPVLMQHVSKNKSVYDTLLKRAIKTEASERGLDLGL